ncbi:MAG: hypothetical protein V3V14_06520, partial [Saprospiraceae bacterium]
MMRVLKVFLLIFMTLQVVGQDYFIKKISFDDRTNDGVKIFYHQDRLFALIGHFCGNLECASIAELSFNGDTLWVTTIPDIDVARSTITIYGNTITVSGNNDPYNTQFRMAHYNLNGQKLGETIEIEHPTEKFTRMFQLNTVKYGDNVLVTGTGEQNDTAYSLIYVMDNQSQIDTLIKIEPSSKYSVMWDVEINSNGELLTFHELDQGGSSEEYRKIIKYNQNLDTIWSYTSEMHNGGGPAVLELEDGRIIYTKYADNASPHHYALRAINPDKTIDWQYQVSNGLESIGNLKQLKNGDIIGLGRFTNKLFEPEINRSPQLFRMTTDGELIWRRVFYELDLSDNESRSGGVRDIVEFDNGDLFGIGEMKYDGQNEVFVFKVDADGCLDGDNCGLRQLITAVKDVHQNKGIDIYPNPSSGVFYIGLNEKYYNGKIKIYNSLGIEIL